MESPSTKMDNRLRRNDKSNDDGENVDIDLLRKEYRNMQANRNAFAHESDLVRKYNKSTYSLCRALIN